MNLKSSQPGVTVILLISLMSQWGWAQGFPSGIMVSKESDVPKFSLGNEFISGNSPGVILMRVNLWGAVGKPGIHFVPTSTDLIMLLSYAGGPIDSAKLNEIYIKRWIAGKQSVIPVDVQELLQGVNQKSPLLQENDIVVIPKSKPVVSQDTVSVVSLISSVLSILTIGILVLKPK